MAGTITKLVIQKKNKDRVNIFIDEQYTLAVTLNVALDLRKGQFLNDEEIAQLKRQDDINKAYHRALDYLSYRARSKQEIRDYLYKKEYSDQAIELTLARLETESYVNDTDFGRAWVENRNRLNPKGKQALQYELRQKGLSEKDIEQALQDLNEEELALQAIDKKLTGWQKLDKAAFRKKLSGFLARRGFNYQIINSTFNRVWQENENDSIIDD